MMRDGARARADVAALASRDATRVTVLAWHYHDDDIGGPDADTTIRVSGLPVDLRRVKVHRVLLDATHGNAFTAWRQMGSPERPDEQQIARMRAASALVDMPSDGVVTGGTVTVRLPLARHAVALILLEW
jgi:xylan 1,4-beta-xylosidase